MPLSFPDVQLSRRGFYYIPSYATVSIALLWIEPADGLLRNDVPDVTAKAAPVEVRDQRAAYGLTRRAAP